MLSCSAQVETCNTGNLNPGSVTLQVYLPYYTPTDDNLLTIPSDSVLVDPEAYRAYNAQSTDHDKGVAL